VLSRLDLELPPGSLYALMGANGAGKTTLMQCLAGQLRPTAGDILWFGQSPVRNVRLRRFVGLAFHETGLYPELSARENLLFAARMQQLSAAAWRVDEGLSEAQLEHYSAWQTSRLSKGIRQRLSLIRSWLHEPRLLLLDEPFAALDEAGQAWLIRRLQTLRSIGTTIFFSCHDPSLAEQLADRVLRLEHGRLLDSKDSVLARRRA
jgi:ABC-type multidrug transport system ATPase subunit